MIRYKASEIIHSALKLSALNNTKLFTERDFVEVLNTQYRSIYNLLTDAGDGHYTKEFIARDFQRGPEGNTVIDLPKDFYQLTFVGTYNDWNPSLAQRIDKIPSSSPGLGYKLVNKQIHISNNMEGPFLIRYVPVPKTITTPAPTLTFDPSIINANCKYTAKWHSFWTLDENYVPPIPPDPDPEPEDKSTLHQAGMVNVVDNENIIFYMNLQVHQTKPLQPGNIITSTTYNYSFPEMWVTPNIYALEKFVPSSDNPDTGNYYSWNYLSASNEIIIRISRTHEIVAVIDTTLENTGLIGIRSEEPNDKYSITGNWIFDNNDIVFRDTQNVEIFRTLRSNIVPLENVNGYGPQQDHGAYSYNGYQYLMRDDYEYDFVGRVFDSSFVPVQKRTMLMSTGVVSPLAINNNDEYKLGLYVIDQKQKITIDDDIANPGGDVWILNDVVVNKNGTFRLIQIEPKPIMVKISNLTFNDVINIAFPDGNCFLTDGTLDETEYPLADNVWKYAFGILERRGNLLFWNDLDYTEYFLGVDRTLDDYSWDVYGNFIFLQKDHRLRIWNGFEKYHHDDFADDAIPGIVDILCSTSTDDRSLYGVHINNCQLASFVPDTVLDYPNNAFYDLLIARVASQLLLIAKQDPSNAVMLAGQLETQLLKTIRRDAFNFPTVNNVYRRRSI